MLPFYLAGLLACFLTFNTLVVVHHSPALRRTHRRPLLAFYNTANDLWDSLPPASKMPSVFLSSWTAALQGSTQTRILKLETGEQGNLPVDTSIHQFPSLPCSLTALALNITSNSSVPSTASVDELGCSLLVYKDIASHSSASALYSGSVNAGGLLFGVKEGNSASEPETTQVPASSPPAAEPPAPALSDAVNSNPKPTQVPELSSPAAEPPAPATTSTFFPFVASELRDYLKRLLSEKNRLQLVCLVVAKLVTLFSALWWWRCNTRSCSATLRTPEPPVALLIMMIVQPTTEDIFQIALGGTAPNPFCACPRSRTPSRACANEYFAFAARHVSAPLAESSAAALHRQAAVAAVARKLGRLGEAARGLDAISEGWAAYTRKQRVQVIHDLLSQARLPVRDHFMVDGVFRRPMEATKFVADEQAKTKIRWGVRRVLRIWKRLGDEQQMEVIGFLLDGAVRGGRVVATDNTVDIALQPSPSSSACQVAPATPDEERGVDTDRGFADERAIHPVASAVAGFEGPRDEKQAADAERGPSAERTATASPQEAAVPEDQPPTPRQPRSIPNAETARAFGQARLYGQQPAPTFAESNLSLLAVRRCPKPVERTPLRNVGQREDGRMIRSRWGGAEAGPAREPQDENDSPPVLAPLRFV